MDNKISYNIKNIQYNIQINNQMQNDPNYNKLFINNSYNLTEEEIENYKKFIINGISKYREYSDISRSISNDCHETYGGYSIVIVGEREISIMSIYILMVLKKLYQLI